VSYHILYSVSLSVCVVYKITANEQGFVQVWHSMNVKPGTKAD
jgi:hypothetical protein